MLALTASQWLSNRGVGAQAYDWLQELSTSCQFMFADLYMQVLAVKPSSKNTFIRCVFVRNVSWNLNQSTVAFKSCFVVGTQVQRPTDGHRVLSVVVIYMPVLAVKPFKKILLFELLLEQRVCSNLTSTVVFKSLV
jgi:hypothetical protein